MTISRRDFLGKSLKTGLALAIPTILTRKVRAGTIYNIGKLEIQNWVNDYKFSKGYHTTFHQPGGTDGFDGLDVGYSGPPFWINPVTTKIISRVLDYELGVDTRGLDSFAPVDLELSLHSEHDIPISVSNLENFLRCIIDPNKKGWTFLPKPITLWRRFLAEPDKLQFLADIREACAKQGGTGIVPLPNLDGEYQSQIPYDFLQLRFDVYPGDFNLDGKVDMKDLPYIGNDWGKQGNPLDFIGDITGPQGLPDGNVDGFDLERKIRDWLKNIRDIMP
jgi:hypothetical protein